ncbi:CspA family cold shock protein [Glaciihabitans sp. UYNi722]
MKFFKFDKGWGAISSDDLPTGHDVFVHFSVIQTDGYRAFEVDDEVDFDFEPAIQDSFRFAATRARKIASGS